MIGAEEAFRLGLVEKVVPTGKKIEATLEFLSKVMEKGPLGVRAAKKVINRVRDMNLSHGLELESDLWASLTATEDMKEGARAFIEKRKPHYKCQ
jgi:enoyl-CoA hydratase